MIGFFGSRIMRCKFVEKLMIVLPFSVILFFLPAYPVDAGQMEEEIEHLLNYVSNSKCVFVRNGDEHDSKEAVDHILRKYEYFKDDIRTTEAFIELCATRSTISDKEYYIKCGSKENIRSKDWLMKELMMYRSR